MKRLAALLITVVILGASMAVAQLRSPTGSGPLTNSVAITTDENYRYVRSNGIPDHEPGKFPNRHNPNTIRPQRNFFRVPLHPIVAKLATPFVLGKFGVAVNGVPFDPGAAEFWNRDFNSGWQYEALSGKIDLGLDYSNAHVQPTGSYHYHGMPNGLIIRLGLGKRVTLVGYAGDGFPVYARYGHSEPDDAKSEITEMKPSFRLKPGTRPNGPRGRYDGTFVQDWEYVAGAGDLDECNGRFGVTPEYPEGIYHYYITEQFPFVPRSFRGTPDPTFLGPQGPPPGGGRPPGPPPFGGPPPPPR